MINKPGTYVLLFRSARHQQVKIGKLGVLELRPGYYLYVGSAFGPGGIKARLAHHQQRTDRPHWHVDYLRQVLAPVEYWYTHDPCHREHLWAGVMADLSGLELAMQGFGASDCHCACHLFYCNGRPSYRLFATRLRCERPEPAPCKRVLLENRG